jgi:hypothetical protein
MALALRAAQHSLVSNDRTPTEALSNLKETGTLHVKVSPDAARTLKESDTAIVDVMIMPPAPAVR